MDGRFKQIVNNPGGGVMLLGKEGTGVFTIALELAEDIANYNSNRRLTWENHNDIHVIDLLDGKRDITMEQIQEIRENENLVPLYSRINIYVIGHADHMNISVQNSLLKVLEDGYSNNIIIMCCENPLIDTVCNRCTVIKVGRFIYPNELQKAADLAGVPCGIVRAALDDRFEWLEHMENKGSLKKILKMVDSFRNLKEPRQLLFTLDAMAEGKDNDFIKNSDSIEQMSLFYGLEGVLFDILDIKYHLKPNCIEIEEAERLAQMYNVGRVLFLIERCMKAREQIRKKVFTKNDYFEIVCSFVDSEIN